MSRQKWLAGLFKSSLQKWSTEKNTIIRSAVQCNGNMGLPYQKSLFDFLFFTELRVCVRKYILRRPVKLLVELHLFHNFCPVLSCICQNSSHGCCDDKGSYFPANATPVRIFFGYWICIIWFSFTDRPAHMGACRYCFYLVVQTGFFAPQGRHVAALNVKFGESCVILAG